MPTSPPPPPPIHDLFNDTSQLPKTVRGELPYEVMALTPREVWGHGAGSTTLDMRQTWNDAATWIRYMLGEWEVTAVDTFSGYVPDFRRFIPEPLRYSEAGNDPRIQWCTGITQTEQGGNPVDELFPELDELPFSQSLTFWPKTLWCKYQGVWETTPYVIRTDDQIADMQMGVAPAEPREFLRYVVRSKRSYSKEQPLPGGTPAGGFKVIETPPAVPPKAIGQVGFRVVSYADVQYKWVGVPLGWPPPPGWAVPAPPAIAWPPPRNPAYVGGTITKRTRDSYIGTINSLPFDYTDPEGYCFDTGELLYTGYDEVQYYNASGQRTCDITFRFRYKEGGWNKFLSALGGWVEVSLTGTSEGTKPYQSKDFKKLFDYTATA